MRIANLAGRAVLLGTAAVDVATASEGRFGPDPMSVWADWEAFRQWASTVDVDAAPAAQPFEVGDLDAPVPVPQQVFAIGLNYADHAAETSMALPTEPLVFTKFPSSLTGPEATVRLRGDRVDWEAELVVVIGEGGRDLPAGWDAVAGLTVGQDLSDRTVQNRGDRPQFGLGKSFAGYAPTGPAVVTVDEVGEGRDLGALRIGCRLTGPDGDEVLQDGTTADMVFAVPELIARLSAIVELRPGDLIFTGTPSGVGLGRTPQRFLQPGQVLVTEIEGVGSIRQTFTA
ncbi:MAG TPA: fumarylacetoacetate hydrolase family protein [Amnibacterium sp.]|jgi:2-keto-4-pentenoate hydratase/2-oxohepta-3-ene-1,7-dioic acid hydratase in catechol pathway|uniref:fumarylacetoacetate hydrolase family protein n=1 Tax=Amnibacterium sp. TaxID=1872496 RepID=UPI002F9582D4